MPIKYMNILNWFKSKTKPQPSLIEEVIKPLTKIDLAILDDLTYKKWYVSEDSDGRYDVYAELVKYRFRANLWDRNIPFVNLYLVDTAEPYPIHPKVAEKVVGIVTAEESRLKQEKLDQYNATLKMCFPNAFKD